MDQFEKCHANGMDIVRTLFIDETLTEKLNLINKWHEKTSYIPKRIECQKRIANTLYEQKKYYLD